MSPLDPRSRRVPRPELYKKRKRIHVLIQQEEDQQKEETLNQVPVQREARVEREAWLVVANRNVHSSAMI